jgi:hypothetical protein
MITLSPASISSPFSRYSLGIVVLAGDRLVFCSGQTAADAAVSCFSRPEFVVEIEIIAAGAALQSGSEGTA